MFSGMKGKNYSYLRIFYKLIDKTKNLELERHKLSVHFINVSNRGVST